MKKSIYIKVVVAVIVVLIIIVIGNNYYNNQNIVIVDLSKDNENKQIQIESLRNSLLESEEMINSLSNEIRKTEDLLENDKLINEEVLSENIEQNMLFFTKEELSEVHGVYQLEDNTPLYSLPSKESVSLSDPNKSSVKIFFTVVNENNTRWAFVHHLNHQSNNQIPYGYVPVDSLTQQKDTYVSGDEGIILYNEIEVGDSKYKVIDSTNGNYLEYGMNLDGSLLVLPTTVDYSYTDENNSYPISEGVTVYIDYESEKAIGANILASGFIVEGGFEVGSDALNVITYYKSKYKEFVSENFTYNEDVYLFELTSDYVIAFYMDTNENKSVVRAIRIELSVGM